MLTTEEWPRMNIWTGQFSDDVKMTVQLVHWRRIQEARSRWTKRHPEKLGYRQWSVWRTAGRDDWWRLNEGSVDQEGRRHARAVPGIAAHYREELGNPTLRPCIVCAPVPAANEATHWWCPGGRMRSLRHGCRSAGSARRPLRRKGHYFVTAWLCVSWSERVMASYVRPLRQDLVIKFKVAVTFMVNSVTFRRHYCFLIVCLHMWMINLLIFLYVLYYLDF